MIFFGHRIYNSMYVPVPVLSCVESSTVAGLSNSPLTMTAHTVTVPSPSLTVYSVLSKPIVTPEGRKREVREEAGRECEGKWKKKMWIG